MSVPPDEVSTALDDLRVRHVIGLIDRYRASPLSIDQMARAVNLSPSYLTRLFRSHTGHSPSQFSRDRRLRHAFALVQQSFLSIKEIMAAVGWSNPSNFCRAFKHRFGVSPKLLRRNLRAHGDATRD
jgi:AraC-like DNA-binding protein